MQIPVLALPVVEILRSEVVPKYDWNKNGRCADGKCPMGLHPLANRKTPMSITGFNGVRYDDKLPESSDEFHRLNLAVITFLQWWDNLKDLGAYKEAAELIWPRN